MRMTDREFEEVLLKIYNYTNKGESEIDIDECNKQFQFNLSKDDAQNSGCFDYVKLIAGKYKLSIDGKNKVHYLIKKSEEEKIKENNEERKIKIAEESNKIARKENRLSIVSIAIALGAAIISLIALFK